MVSIEELKRKIAERKARIIAEREAQRQVDEEEKQRAKKMGITDLDKKYMMNELVTSNEAMFSATGVTDGTILKGVSFLSDGAKTHSIVMRAKTKTVRFIEATHKFEHFPDY